MNEHTKQYRGVIYKRTSPSGKVYIGQTYDEDSRNANWRSLASPYTSKNSKIDNARKKYGPENFTYEILFETKSANLDLTKKILSDLEIYYISYYNSWKEGYNSTRGGLTYGGKNNDDKVVKIPVIQLSKKGEYINEWESASKAAKDVYGNGRKYSGRILKCCRHEKVSVKEYRWIFKEEYDNLKDKSILLKNPEDKKIIQLSLDGKFIKEWNTLTEIEKELGINASLVLSVCKRYFGHKTAGNFRWLYKSEFISGNYDKTIIYERELNAKKVIQFSLLGKFIKEWDNVKEAAKNLNISDEDLIRTAAVKRKTCNGFRWIYKDDWDGKDLPEMNYLNNIEKRKIIQLSISGNYIKKWNSFNEIKRELNYSTKQLSRACREKIIYENYLWIYEKDYIAGKINLENFAFLDSKRKEPILQFNLSNDLIKEWESISAVEKHYQKPGFLRRLFNKGENIYDNYYWTRKKDYLKNSSELP